MSPAPGALSPLALRLQLLSPARPIGSPLPRHSQPSGISAAPGLSRSDTVFSTATLLFFENDLPDPITAPARVAVSTKFRTSSRNHSDTLTFISPPSNRLTAP